MYSGESPGRTARRPSGLNVSKTNVVADSEREDELYTLGFDIVVVNFRPGGGYGPPPGANYSPSVGGGRNTSSNSKTKAIKTRKKTKPRPN